MSGEMSSTSYDSIRPRVSGPAWRQIRSLSLTGSSFGPGSRRRTSGARGAAPAASPRPRTPRRRRTRTRSSSRRASPSGVRLSARKCPPQDSVRCRASMHISSASSRKSATRPAFSSAWLRSAASPVTRTRAQNSSRSARTSPDRLAQPRVGALHSAVVPHDPAEPAVERVGGPVAVDGEQPCHPRLDLGADSAGHAGVDRRERAVREVVADRVGQHEVAVGQTLHERGRAEPVGAVVGEVGLADDEQAGDRRAQVVVDPQPAHRVVHGRVDAHRRGVRVLAGDALVHLEQVPVALLDRGPAQPVQRGRRSRGRRPARPVRRPGRRRRRPSPPGRRCRAARGCRTPG